MLKVDTFAAAAPAPSCASRRSLEAPPSHLIMSGASAMRALCRQRIFLHHSQSHGALAA